MTESIETARTAAPPVAAGLPWQIRVARIAEWLFFPVGLISLMAIPFDEVGALAMVGGQVALVIAAAVGLGRRRRWAWIVAMAMAAFFVARIVDGDLPAMVSDLKTIPRTQLLAGIMMGWALLTQLIVLWCCLALLRRGRWRTELH